MNWSVGILTSARPRPTLADSLASLIRAGWNDFHVYNDVEKRGQLLAWFQLVKDTMRRNPLADYLLLCEDDIAVWKGLRPYLESGLPGNPDETLMWSPYSPKAYMAAPRGWHVEDRGHHLVSCLTWVMPMAKAKRIIDEVSHLPHGLLGADRIIGEWAGNNRLKTWFHVPSLVQHTGLMNSSIGDMLVSDIRHAGDFIGEYAEGF